LLALQLEQIDEIYDFGDRLIAFQGDMMDKQIADTNIFPEALHPNLRNVYVDSVYYKKMMLTWTSPGHAVTGNGSRVWTWHNREVDTLYIKQ
jgi:hypothetical protein